MIYPILYSPNTTDFRNNGLGFLAGATKCHAVRNLGGAYELQLAYPRTGRLMAKLTDRALIKAKIPQVIAPQIFEIYSVEKTMPGLVSVKAQHISYRMSGIPVEPFTAPTLAGALGGLKDHAIGGCPFSFTTDKHIDKEFALKTPSSIASCLRGQEGSIVDTYGGELDIDNYNIKLYSRMGQNRGVTIRYGKNLLDLRQEQNCCDVISGIYPYWQDYTSGDIVQLSERIISYPDLPYSSVRPLDMTSFFEEKPTEEQLRETAKKYLKNNKLWMPRIDLDVSYVQLEQTEEYKGQDLLERVMLGDTVRVVFPALGVDATARATEIRYDVLNGRIDRVHLGSPRRTIADTVLGNQQAIENIGGSSALQQAVSSATNWITNGKGYMVAIKDAAGNWTELCSLDTPDIKTAVNVWRFNNGGLGHSKNGYNGPYELALTQDGKIVADFITTGTLDAALVKIKNLIADHVRSPGPKGSDTVMEIDGAKLALKKGNIAHFRIDYIEEGNPHVYLIRRDPGAGPNDDSATEITGSYIRVGGKSYNPGFSAAYNKTKSWIQLRNGDAIKPAFEVSAENGVASMTINGGIQTGRNVILSLKKPMEQDFGSRLRTKGYNLFAIQLGDLAHRYLTTVLAYRQGNQVRGIGGQCGTHTTKKELQFVTFSLTPLKDSYEEDWILEDAGRHQINMDGSWAPGEKLAVWEIIAIC